jgi:hypothetical protein
MLGHKLAQSSYIYSSIHPKSGRGEFHSSSLQILLGHISLSITVFPHMLLPSTLICLKRSYLLRIHMLGHLIRLPLLERESQSLVAIILIICLVFVVLDADEVAMHCLGIQGKGDKCVDSGGFGNDLEGPGLEHFSQGRMS